MDCMTEFYLPSGDPILLQPASMRKFKGPRLPGADLTKVERDRYSLSVHTYSSGLFHLSLRHFHCHNAQDFIVRESSSWLRLETVITGDLKLLGMGDRKGDIQLRPGEYWRTNHPACRLSFGALKGAVYLVIYLSPELLGQLPASETSLNSPPRLMTLPARGVVTRLFTNPFNEDLRKGFYDYSIRELLFSHAAAPAFVEPGELTPTEISLMYAVDAIISGDLTRHYTISELAHLVGTNEKIIKTHFVKVFGMSTFDRHIFLKMKRAKYLLETTDLQIQEVGEMSGYETPTGFINSFRDMFEITPLNYRLQSRGLPPADEGEGMLA